MRLSAWPAYIQKPKLDEKQKKEAKRLKAQGWTLKEMADHFHVATATVHRIVRRGYASE